MRRDKHGGAERMRLVLCDENRILGEALAAAIGAREHQVLAVTTTVADGLAAVATHRPDVVVLDPRFSDKTRPCTEGETDGLGAARQFQQHYPETAILVLASLAEPQMCAAAMKSKLAGFLPKDRRVSELADALDVIAQGGVAFDSRLARQAMKGASSTRRRSRPAYVLTPREKEVLRRIVAGQGTAQMAGEMNITASTVRTYVKNLLAKLGAHSRLQAAALAARGDFPDELSA